MQKNLTAWKIYVWQICPVGVQKVKQYLHLDHGRELKSSGDGYLQANSPSVASESQYDGDDNDVDDGDSEKEKRLI